MIIRIRFVVQAPQPLVFVAEVSSTGEAMRLAEMLKVHGPVEMEVLAK